MCTQKIEAQVEGQRKPMPNMSFVTKFNFCIHSTFSNWSRVSATNSILQKTWIPQVQCVRNKNDFRRRRQRLHLPKWYTPRKNKSIQEHGKEITPENKGFLQEVVQDRFKPSLESPLKDEPWKRKRYKWSTKRTGVLAIKIGAIPQWKKDGTKIYTTMLQIVDNHVIRYIPPEVYSSYPRVKPFRNKCGSVVVGALSADPVLFRKDYCNLFLEAGVPPKRKLTRFLVTPDAAIQPGTPLTANHFKVGDYVDLQAKTIAHGFQGVMKRWGFKGGPATHGSTKFHRRPGSIGHGSRKRVKRGKKMPGMMGNRWRYLNGLKIWRINTKYNVLYVSSPMTPGPTHCYVRVYDTVLPLKRKEMMANPPYNPTFYPDQDAQEELPEDILHEDLHPLNSPSIVYSDAKS